MKKLFITFFAVLFSLSLCSCGESRELVDMEGSDTGEYYAVTWEDRTYIPFCVVDKNDRGGQIGYVNGDKDNRISEYKEFPAEDWLVSWMPTDGGAMLLKEKNVTEIPEGLTDEYGYSALPDTE